MLMKELREIIRDSFILFFRVLLFMLWACFLIALFWLCIAVPLSLGGNYPFLLFLTIPLFFIVYHKLEKYAER